MTSVTPRLSALAHRVRGLAGSLRRGKKKPLWWRWRDRRWERPWRIEARFDAAVNPERARAWIATQSLSDLIAVGIDRDGHMTWRCDRHGHTPAPRPADAFLIADLDTPLDRDHVETVAAVLGAEAIDAVIYSAAVDDQDDEGIDLVYAARLLPFTLFRATAWRWSPGTGVENLEARLIKRVRPSVIDAEAHGTAEIRRRVSGRRRGPYRSRDPLPAQLAIDVGMPPPRPVAETDTRIPLVVTVPFLARGGAEHTLFETLRVLADRWAVSLVTLAPHRPELGDRRDDFRAVTTRILCLGDVVHPATMPGILVRLFEATGATQLYNANGTTLFYDFVPILRRHLPRLRVIDHLYDHRVGYIERYADTDQRPWIDTVVAENHPVAHALIERGWPRARVPVVWPCGRADDVFPSRAERPAIRARIRAELGLHDDDLVFLMAARMHDQKRPLDLIELAARCRDLDRVAFVMVGGGPLSRRVDRAIATTPGVRIFRLPFRTDIPELIVAADVGCLVSDYEGLPVFLLECLQAGRPFLGTDVGDLGTVLRDTGAGLVVDRPGDIDGLAAAVRRLTDKEVRAELAERARLAAPRFGVEACAQRYGDVLSNPAAYRGPTPPYRD